MLMRKRGAPVLVELMKGRAADPVGAPRPAATTPIPPTLTGQIPTARADTIDSAAAGLSGLGTQSLGGAGGSSGGAKWWFQPWYLVSAAALLVLIVWGIAYSAGRSAGQRAGDERIRQVVGGVGGVAGAGTESAPRGGVSDPLAGSTPPPVAPGPTTALPPPTRPTAPPGQTAGRPADTTGTAPPQGTPPTSTPPTVPPAAGAGLPPVSAGVATTLQAGLNYLVVADLAKDDAEAAAAYLNSRGVPTALVPQRSTVQVVVLRGYPGEVFAERKPERAQIEALVKRLGREWRLENRRAPTDFAQIFWAKLRE
jgi:hypothetical protein